MQKHIAVYIRVSSGKQDTASQEPELKRWIAAQPEGAAVVWYRDKFTGKTMDRPGMQKLLTAVAAGEVSTLLVWRLDRLGRTASGLTKMFEDLQHAKVNLVSVKDGLDLATPAGRLMANVLASVASFETELRGERILAGIAAKRSRGEKWGNGRPKGSRSKCTPEKMKLVRQMHADGQGVTTIADTLGLSRQSVYSILKEA